MNEFQPSRFGKYILAEKLATGGMAQLYIAKIVGIEGFEKLVAIKMILPHLAKEKEFVESFIDEAKLAALLNHQNNVQIYDFGCIDESYFICMEYLLGKDLRAIINQAREQKKPISLENALYITSRVCAGLDYAHNLKDMQGNALNLIHRDISPQNIFVTYQGEVKILDFGIAKATTQSTLTQFGMIKGKVAYMSPEQANGEDIDNRSDIFSTGIVLYEMITGKKLFTGESTMQILAKVRDCEFADPEAVIKGLPDRVYSIIRRGLEKDRNKRYQSCGEMLADIEDCMLELSIRPSARSLSEYMRELFKDVIDREEHRLHEIALISLPKEQDSTSEVKEQERAKVEVSGQVSEAIETFEKKKRRFMKMLISGIAVFCVILGIIAVIFFQARKPKVVHVPPDATKTEHITQKPSSGDTEASKRAKELIGQASAILDKEPHKAGALLEEAIKLDHKNPDGYFQMGLLAMHKKDYRKGIEAFLKVVEIDPKFPDIYFNLGYAYAMIKDYPNAEKMYRHVVDLSPPYLDEALTNLAVIQHKRGNKKESRENLERAIKINPNNALAKKYLKDLKR